MKFKLEQWLEQYSHNHKFYTVKTRYRKTKLKLIRKLIFKEIRENLNKCDTVHTLVYDLKIFDRNTTHFDQKCYNVYVR